MVTTSMKAELYIVATPIGNLADISQRALEVLAKVDWIAAEDTRHSLRLLNHYGIKRRLLSLHEFNENKRSEEVLNLLLKGESVALISDAGTPLISDPGFVLVAKAHENDIRVTPVPGPCAAIVALSASGLPTHQFVFEGFLPSKGEKRTKRLQALALLSSTIIIYESVHRISNLLELLVQEFGSDRLACVARELTKTYETIKRAPLGELSTWLNADSDQQKGEFVVVVAGTPAVNDVDDQEMDRILTTLLSEVPLKQAVKLAQQLTGLSRQKLYQRALELKKVKS